MRVSRWFFLVAQRCPKPIAYLIVFSEDIDLRVLTESSLDKPSTLRAALSKFKHAIIERLQEEGFPIEDRHVRARDNNRFFAIEIALESWFPRSESAANLHSA